MTSFFNAITELISLRARQATYLQRYLKSQCYKLTISTLHRLYLVLSCKATLVVNFSSVFFVQIVYIFYWRRYLRKNRSKVNKHELLYCWVTRRYIFAAPWSRCAGYELYVLNFRERKISRKGTRCLFKLDGNIAWAQKVNVYPSSWSSFMASWRYAKTLRTQNFRTTFRMIICCLF